MSTPPSEMKVITDNKKMIDYIFMILEKSPKKFRYTFVTRIQNVCLDIIELYYEANDLPIEGELRKIKQNEIKTKYKLLDYLCDMAFQQKCILFKQYEQISKQMNACNRLLNSWMLSDLKRKQKQEQ